jgi:hypothetical protein
VAAAERLEDGDLGEALVALRAGLVELRLEGVALGVEQVELVRPPLATPSCGEAARALEGDDALAVGSAACSVRSRSAYASRSSRTAARTTLR